MAREPLSVFSTRPFQEPAIRIREEVALWGDVLPVAGRLRKKEEHEENRVQYEKCASIAWRCRKDMKTISFACPNCGKQFNVDAKLAGKRGNCAGCGNEMVVPAPPELIPPEKSAAMGIGLNLLLFGCGYFYLGLIGGGIACLLFDAALLVAFFGNINLLAVGIVLQVIGALDIVIRCGKMNKERLQLVESYQAWKAQADKKTCPYCGERIQKSAILCRFCGSKLEDI